MSKYDEHVFKDVIDLSTQESLRLISSLLEVGYCISYKKCDLGIEYGRKSKLYAWKDTE